MDGILSPKQIDNLEQQHVHLRQMVIQTTEQYLTQHGFQPRGKQSVYTHVLCEMEAGLWTAVLQYTKGNQRRASQILGISRTTLRQRKKVLGEAVKWPTVEP